MVLPLLGPLPAAGQPAVAEPQLLRIASITPWVDRTHPLTVSAQITNPTESSLANLSIHLSVFARVANRSQLRNALDGRPSTASIGGTTEYLDGSIAPGRQRSVVIRRDVRTLGARLTRTGVYPLVITLRSTAGRSTVSTAMPFLGSRPQARLNVTWVLPLTRPTQQRADGVYPPDALSALGLEEMTRQMEVIAARPGLAVTLAPSPSLLDTLADLADGFTLHGATGAQPQARDSDAARRAGVALDSIRRATATAGEIATVPYAAVDMPSMVHRGLRADLLRQITFGRSATETRLGRAPALSALVPPGLSFDRSGATAVAPLGITGVALAPSSLAQQPIQPFQPEFFGPSRPIALKTNGGPLAAMLPDQPLSDRGDGPEQGALLGQAIVAETASAWLELPALAADRAILIASARTPGPSALAPALDGLAGAPWVRMRTLSDALVSLPAQGAPITLVRRSPPDRPHLVHARAARRFLLTYSAIAAQPVPELDALNRLVLLSESAEWNADADTGSALARAVTARVRAVLAAIRVVRRQVTLTSRTGDVPVTVVNENEFPLRLRLLLQSPKVTFPKGNVRTVDVPTPNHTEDFKIEARTAGAFPLAVRVETPDGGRLLARGELIVRSTAVSAVALIALGGGAFFLLAAWLRRDARRRKQTPGP